ncbi:MAG: hypothetical protein MN733_38175 [Nitrososphaera sp.]|nr:hypothetical protein [Nitrososphaera sp.]
MARHVGVIVACAILLVLGLAVTVLGSPQGQEFLEMYKSGGLQPMSGLTGQPGQISFGMPW